MESSYSVLPAVYDQFVADRSRNWSYSYDLLMNYLDERVRDWGMGRRVLSMGAGTCRLEIEMCRRGYGLTCLDLSEEMLRVARESADRAGLPAGAEIEMVQGDMRDFSFTRPFDLIMVNYYAMNYLTRREDLAACFASARRAMAPGGAFLFDVMHNERADEQAGQKMQRFTQSDKLTSLHEARYGEDGLISSELTFFYRQGETYLKFTELHEQRVYRLAELTRLLRAAGFGEVGTYSYATLNPPTEADRRVMMIARQ